MITAIIFSKDRACQLHLLLESIQKNWPDLQDIHIIRAVSNEDFRDGYDKLREANGLPPFYMYHEQETFGFKLILKDLVKTSESLLTFFCDDDIIYRSVDVTEAQIEETMGIEELSTLSLRLGQNTTYQYLSADDKHNCPVPQRVFQHGPFLLWDFRTLPSWTNFGYPLSVEGHIFKQSFMQDIVNKEDFDFYDPNSFEGKMQQFLGTTPPIMGCCETNYIVNTPINRVQDTCLNRAGDEHGITAESLNDSYLNGDTINLEAIDFSNIVGCQQELALPFHHVVTAEATVHLNG